MLPANVQPYIPPLKAPLPTFDGKYENWFAFKNMFENVMDRYHTETPAIKLYHLRNALVGAAAGIIDQDIINNNDYNAAWETLKERYEDKQVIVDKHIDAIFNMPAMIKENANALRKIIDTCCKHVDALKNLELPVQGLGEVMLLNILSKKLDIETRKAWELSQTKGDLAKYSSTMDFLKERCRVYEKISRCSKPTEIVKQIRPIGKAEPKIHSLVAATGKCSHCREDHELWRCKLFKGANLSDKYASLRKSGSCFNCLEKGHITGKCKSEHNCKKCAKRHHTILHPEDAQSTETEPKTNPTTKKEAPKANSEANTSSASSNTTGSVLCSSVEDEQDTLLATAVATIIGPGTKSSTCRAVLDSASHKHFITEALVLKLGLKQKRSNYTIIGIGGNRMTIQFKVHARIKSRINEYVSPCLEFLVVNKITGKLPVQCIDPTRLKIPDNIELADPSFNVPGQVEILIGSGLFFKLIKGGQLNLEDHMPAVQETQLGWIVSGVIPTNHVGVGQALCGTLTENDVGKLLEQFWHFDSYDERPVNEYSSEDACVAHFLDTHRRDDHGRFVVRLPFNSAKEQLGNSREMAKRRFLAVERRLDRDLSLKTQYIAFMREYKQMNHMAEITPSVDEMPSDAFYLPHQCVLKPTSTTTKLRVVFDVSAESSSGVSINQAQIVGPTIQNDLISILLKFRSFRYALSADIPKMYRQVEVHPNDTCFQRIFWRESRDHQLKIYNLRTVTYGLASSPFLATMALRQLADDEEQLYPLAAKAVKNSFYIDDMLSGADSEEEAIELLQQVRDMLHSGGFDVHKVCSNSSAVLQVVPEDKRETINKINDPEINMLMKTLGIAWEPTTDNFTISLPKMQVSQPSQLTKRILLSEISRIFDPLGFLGPVLTTAKLVMREVWMLHLKWDEVLPHALASFWLEFRDQLEHVEGIKIPRCVLSGKPLNLELHGFADASDLAYGACLYARSIMNDGQAKMKLICSKSRTLPKKQKSGKEFTTPRAELQAALMLSRLVAKIVEALEVKFSSIILWSDSQIVLCWIQKSPEALQVFVANRVKLIQSLTDEYIWRYIPSKSNPADMISRGVQPQLLPNLEMWWSGPSILNQADCELSLPPLVSDVDLPELRKTVVCSRQPKRMKMFDTISRFSIMQRSMAYVVRYTDYIRSGREVLTKGLLTADEMNRAMLLIVRLVQNECFAAEIRALKEEKYFEHPLKCLNPFFDENDKILRVGGRIKNAAISYDSKHQMLLPQKHPVTLALIRYLHRSNWTTFITCSNSTAILAVTGKGYDSEDYTPVYTML
ncbi:uncharacterized protein LOC129716774 [Wyeomyia smithii]|uniref:uncharacterized protein LOC129716774 n=1 Tax=Wyeomyia smithii TaxID=174621 RepID=UPI002467F9D6|nr:uncharacterized protein LOC129716774 [Wyeomyia smithii]